MHIAKVSQNGHSQAIRLPGWVAIASQPHSMGLSALAV
jgi:hypothetical protein